MKWNSDQDQFDTFGQWLAWKYATDMAEFHPAPNLDPDACQQLHQFFSDLYADFYRNPLEYSIPTIPYENSTLTENPLGKDKFNEAQIRESILKVKRVITFAYLVFLFRLGQLGKEEGERLKVDPAAFQALVQEKTRKFKIKNYPGALERLGFGWPTPGSPYVTNTRYPKMLAAFVPLSAACALNKADGLYFFRRCDFAGMNPKAQIDFKVMLGMTPPALRGELEKIDALLSGYKCKREIFSGDGSYRARFKSKQDQIIYWCRVGNPFETEPPHQLRWKLDGTITPRLWDRLDRTHPGLADRVFNGIKHCARCYGPDCSAKTVIERAGEQFEACREACWCNIGTEAEDFTALRVVIEALAELIREG